MAPARKKPRASLPLVATTRSLVAHAATTLSSHTHTLPASVHSPAPHLPAPLTCQSFEHHVRLLIERVRQAVVLALMYKIDMTPVPVNDPDAAAAALAAVSGDSQQRVCRLVPLLVLNTESMPDNGCRRLYDCYQYGEALVRAARAHFCFGDEIDRRLIGTRSVGPPPSLRADVPAPLATGGARGTPFQVVVHVFVYVSGSEAISEESGDNTTLPKRHSCYNGPAKQTHDEDSDDSMSPDFLDTQLDTVDSQTIHQDIINSLGCRAGQPPTHTNKRDKRTAQSLCDVTHMTDDDTHMTDDVTAKRNEKASAGANSSSISTRKRLTVKDRSTIVKRSFQEVHSNDDDTDDDDLDDRQPARAPARAKANGQDMFGNVSPKKGQQQQESCVATPSRAAASKSSVARCSTTARRSSVSLASLELAPQQLDTMLDFYAKLNRQQSEQTRVALTGRYMRLKCATDVPANRIFQLLHKHQKARQKNAASVDQHREVRMQANVAEQREEAMQVYAELGSAESEQSRVAFTLRYMQVQYGVRIDSKTMFGWLKAGAKKKH